MCQHIYNPETIYPKGTFFTYLIGWSKLNKFYYGVRYGKYVRPSDLWKSYFTSSTPVKHFRNKHGEPDIIKVDFVYDTDYEAKEYEGLFLAKIDAANNPSWLNLSNGGTHYHRNKNIVKKRSESAIQKQKEKMFGRIYINDGISQKYVTPEEAEPLYLLGFEKGLLNPQIYPDELKIKRSKELSNTIWVNNGEIQKQVKKEEFIELKKDNYVIGMLYKRTEEAIKKSSDAIKGRVTINNGEFQFRVTPEEAEILSLLGFIVGRLEKYNSNFSEKRKGKFYIHNFDIQLTVTPEEADQLYKYGFLKGPLPEVSNKMTEQRKGKPGTPHTEITKQRLSRLKKDKIVVNNGIEQKSIPKEDVELFYSQGYSNGMLPELKKQKTKKFLEHPIKPRSEEHTQNLIKTRIGRKLLNNGLIQKFAYPDEFESLLNEGYSFGQLPELIKKITQLKIGRFHSEASKEKISNSKKIINNNFQGK